MPSALLGVITGGGERGDIFNCNVSLSLETLGMLIPRMESHYLYVLHASNLIKETLSSLQLPQHLHCGPRLVCWFIPIQPVQGYIFQMS